MQNSVCRSYLLLVLCSCITKFCFKLPLYFFMKHKTSKTYSSVGIATVYWLDGPGIESRWGARLSAPVQTGPGAHPASCTIDTGYFPAVKRPWRGVDHPSRLAPRLKKEYTSTPPLGLRLHCRYCYVISCLLFV